MTSVVQWVTGDPACVAELGDGADQRVADGDDRGRLDRLLEPSASRLSPPRNHRPVAKLGDGDGGQEDLLPDHPSHVRFKVGAATETQRGAEHARVDDNPHASSAAANASSSSSVRPSINNVSSEAITGADAS